MERTSNTVEIQACCSLVTSAEAPHMRQLMQDAVAVALNTTLVYMERAYSVASSGATCVLLLYQAPNQDMVSEGVLALQAGVLSAADGTRFDVDATPWVGTDLEYLGASLPAGWTVSDLVLWGGCSLGLLLCMLSAICCYVILSQKHRHHK